MSTLKPIPPFRYPDRVVEVAQMNVEMITLLYEALTNIARAEVSLDGGIISKSIAEDALVAAHQMAKRYSPLSNISAARKENLDV